MGGNISLRLMRAGHKTVVYDRSSDAVRRLTGEGAAGAGDLQALVAQLEKPRAVWVMLPSGHITESTIEDLGTLMEAGDIIIDGGNSFYKDDIRRAKTLREKGIHYVDVGTSGGVWGLERGYCMMIGGPSDIVDHLDPILRTLAPGMGTVERTTERHNRDPRPEQGYMYCGPAGSGHFVKMVHNGIEYGMMQAYAEGFDVLKTKSSESLPEDQRFSIDVADVAEVWRRGSVVASWLLDLTASSLAADPALSKFGGRVSDSGEGRWTIKAGIDEGVPTPVLTASLYSRFSSRGEADYSNKVLSAMRFAFGGHLEKPHDK